MNESNVTNNVNYDEYDIHELDKKFRITLAIQATLSTFANFTLLATYGLMGKRRKKVANYLLACTSVSDMYVSCLSWYMFMISYMASNSHQYPDYELYNYAHYFLQDYSFVVSLGTVLLSTLDRYFSVKYPIRHRDMTTKPGIKYVILIVWGTSFIPPIVRILLTKVDYMNLYNPTDVVYIYVLHSVILVVIVTTYGLLTNTFITVRNIILNPVKGSRRTRDHMNTLHKRTQRLVKIFIAMTSAYTITYLPIIICYILYTSRYLHTMQEYYVVLVTVFADTFYCFSSLINPVITLSFKKDFRTTLTGFVIGAKLSRRASVSSTTRSTDVPQAKVEQKASSVL